MKNEIRDRVLREHGRRDLQFDRQAVDVKARTVQLSFASEEPYSRWWGVEILDCTASAVRLDRLRDGAALLLNHDRDQQVGVVESVRVGKDRVLRATVRLSRSALGDEVLQDVADGIRTKVSVGYSIHDMVLEREQDGIPTYRVTDWEPFEISIVSIPADVSVGVGRSHSKGSRSMDMNTGTGRRARARAAQARATAGLELIPREDRAQYIGACEHEAQEAGCSVDEVRGGLDIVTDYEDWKQSTIRALADRYKHHGSAELAEGAIERGTTVSAFKRELMAMLGEKMQPTQTGRVEPGFENQSYGTGSREIVHTGPLRAFSADQQGHERAHSWGQWIKAIAGDQRALRWANERGLMQRAMGESNFSSAGFAVPTELVADLIRNVEMHSAYRRYARNWVMSSGATQVPVRLSGVSVGVLAEGSEVSPSDPTGSHANLVSKTLAGACRVQRALLEDSPVNIGDWLVAEFGEALGLLEDTAGFTGDASQSVAGIVGITTKLLQAGHAGSIHTATGHDLFAEFDIADLTGLMSRVPEYARANAAWYCSRSFADSVLTRLALAAGGNSTQTMRQGIAESFAGYPIRIVQVLPSDPAGDLTGVVACLFGDLSRAAIFGDRRSFDFAIDFSPFRTFDQVLFMSTSRFDCNNHMTGSTATVCGPIAGLVGGS